MNALAHSYLFWITLILGLTGLYILPSVIAAIRHVEGLGWIIVLNLLPTGRLASRPHRGHCAPQAHPSISGLHSTSQDFWLHARRQLRS
jgi:hypothetical protein